MNKNHVHHITPHAYDNTLLLKSLYAISRLWSTYVRAYSGLSYPDYTAQKITFSITDLVTFTEEILNGKFCFFWEKISGKIPVES